MPMNSTIGAQKIDHRGSPGTGTPPDWESVRVFLEVTRAGSFRAAAERLGMSGQGIAHRIEQLEWQIGVTLFTRHRNGARLTEDGRHLLSFAEQMEDASRGFVRRRGNLAHPLRGEIRIACTEGLGTFWVTPRLIEFARGHPQILVDLQCSMRRPDELIARAEADLAIQLEPPSPDGVKARRIGRLHIMPCASKSYVDTYGSPKTREEIGEHHKIVLLCADQGKGLQLYDATFPDRSQIGFVALRTNASTSLYASVANGVAIGWLPSYYFAVGAQVIPLDIDLIFSFDIWLSYHPDVGNMPRIRRMIDWTVDIFDPKHCPWFRDDFVHPQEFEKYLGGRAVSAIDVAFGHT